MRTMTRLMLRAVRSSGWIAALAFFAACQGGATKSPGRVPTAPGDAGATPTPPDAGEAREDAGAPQGADAMAARDGGELIPDAAPEEDASVARRPITILMIGDGMGPGQLAAASLYAHGRTGALFLESLPHRGEIITGSLSGITDSAAAATAMATGVKTFNRALGIDRDGYPVETIVELAQRSGMGAGVVTTASLPHATPAGFSAHISERFQYVDIADDQARNVRPFVMLGGGSQFYDPRGPGSERSDDGLVEPLRQAGWQYVTTRGALGAAMPEAGPRLLGIFAPEHLDYVVDRASSSSQPTLTEMSLAALRFLDTYSGGFFLMIEGARIDMASHGNDLLRTVTETIAFDDAVAAVKAWADRKSDDVTLLVTADHECGGLTVISPRGAGTLPEVAWRWGLHTNARISIFGSGPGSERIEGDPRDHTFVHAVMKSALLRQPFVEPDAVLTPDGRLNDLRHLAASQAVATAFGAGFNELDALRLDADRYGLFIGIEGLFEWERNAIVVLLDRDFGASTGLSGMPGALSDSMGRADGILSSLPLDAQGISGFGADHALVVWGGSDPKIDELIDDAGVRGLRPPLGEADDLGWYAAAINFGEGVRTRTMPGARRPGEGFEAFVPWGALYPELSGLVPPGATIAVFAVLVNDDGGFASNQALPPFSPLMTENPGRVVTAVPGVVEFPVDADGDGIGDGIRPPWTISMTP